MSETRELLERIANNLQKERQFFGLTVKEWVVVGSALFTVVGFYVRTDDAIRRLIVLSEYTQGFQENSDGFHSATTGTQFKQGKPVDPTFDFQTLRNRFKYVDNESTSTPKGGPQWRT